MRGAVSAAGLFGLAALAGCATNTSALEEELSRLRREIRALNQKISENDLKIERLEGRVTLLGLGQGGEVAPAPKTPVVGATEREEERPAAKGHGAPAKKNDSPKIKQLTGPGRSLPVVKFGSDLDGSYEQGAIDDGSPPIEIKLVGPAEDELPVDHQVLKKPDPVLGAPKKAKTKIEADADDDPPPPKKVTKAEIKAAYEIALAKLRIDGDPAAARKLFKRFARRYPGSTYLDNVAYWTAECDFAEHDYQAAAKGFQKMIEAFPRSTKVPDALVRQAEARSMLGQTQRADALLAQVIAEHPDSEAAKKAKALLERAQGRR